ncbi:uracil phosphoribosyltransferase [Apiospora marii]|uniref:uracil phosphoribosyltransferase n=1 Tax=Apiospora marii TaxID=335849 RepID=UPI00312D4B6E
MTSAVKVEEPTLKQTKKPIVIGVYGISGSGKTYLLNQLKQELQQEPYEFFDGSEAIASVVPGGFDTFKEANAQDKAHWRELAIREIGKKCATSGHTGVVAGHSMLWLEDGNMIGERIWTQGDASTYTHIFYMDVTANIVAQRRADDGKRPRKPVPADQLAKWQEAEKQSLRHLCHEHGIVYGLIPASPSPLDGIKVLFRNLCQRTETEHRSGVEQEIDQAVLNQGQVETILVLDADKTLAAVDTGDLFWRKLPGRQPSLAEGQVHVLKSLFSGPLGYSSNAFLQAALLYEEVSGVGEFDRLCKDVADEVTVYPEFVSLLQTVAQHQHVGAVVLTCGLRLVWEKVLDREGLSEFVKVIGNGRVENGYIMTPAFKAAAVTRLRNKHQACV